MAIGLNVYVKQLKVFFTKYGQYLDIRVAQLNVITKEQFID